MNNNCLGTILGSFWAVWKGLLWCLKVKLRSWRFQRYWQFNKWYHGGYQLICLISQPLLIALRRNWYLSKGLFKGFRVPLRLWESSKNWWRYGQMKFVTGRPLFWNSMVWIWATVVPKKPLSMSLRSAFFFCSKTHNTMSEQSVAVWPEKRLWMISGHLGLAVMVKKRSGLWKYLQMAIASWNN